jgi:tRNA pseudouridine13 synthase
VTEAAHHARGAALAPPRAYAGALETAVLRAAPEDFVVEEELGFLPSGDGPHLLLRVRKRDANTAWVARELARAAGCRPFEVGYAGLKDRRAVAVQWFSVPRSATNWQGLRGEGFEVLEAHAHRRKLPRGALAGNHFTVRVRALHDGAGLVARLAPRLEEIRRRGVPNYFGPQRFGRGGANLTRAAAPPASLAPQERGFVLSAARSALFNAVLAERVTDGSWERLLPGDLAILDGRGSVFPVPQADEELAGRCQRLEIHPSGPLWGAGEVATAAAVHALESRVAQLLPAEAALCVGAGMRQERRSLRLAVRELGWEAQGDSALLQFRLARGCFATAVLRELFGAISDAPDA